MFSNFTKYSFDNFGYIRLPEIKISEAEKTSLGLSNNANNFEVLKALVVKGMKEKTPKINADEYKQRVIKELKLVQKLNFVDYFLLVWLVTSYCDKKRIGRDYGRGSVAGSLIAFYLGITGVDPIKYNLYFERFLSEARAKSKIVDGVVYIYGELAPDVDIDIDPLRRPEVIDYLRSLYPNRVSKISTFNTLSGKLLIKECGKIIAEKEESELTQIVEYIPKKFGFVADIEDAINGKKKDDGTWDVEPSKEFKEWVDKNTSVYENALKLRDLIKNISSHPSGYLIGYDELTTSVPLEFNKDDELTCCYNMSICAELNIKLDLLASRCSTVVQEVLDLVGVKVEDINIDNDPIIYDNLQNLLTPKGIFQIEADFVYQVVKKIKPKNLSELSDIMAIGRPGALAYMDGYAKNEEHDVHELFKPILKPTRYYCLYQEQMMQLLHAVGFTLEEAEICRRIVGKKKKEEVAKWKDKIYDKITEKNLPKNLADELWKILDDSSSYSFNKSHALSFASLSALTAYLKFKYPLQFFLVLLRQTKNEPAPFEEISSIEKELRYFGIKLLPPSIVKSDEFEIEGNNIRFGLSSIKGISDKSIGKVSALKGNFKNKFEVFQAAQDSKINIGIFCALIQSGALQDFGESRTRLVLEAQLYNILTDKEKVLVHQCAKGNDDLIHLLRDLKTKVNEKGKLIIKESRMETIKKKAAPYITIYKMNSKNERLANFWYERKFLGYTHSITLKDIYKKYDQDLVDISELAKAEAGDSVHIVGLVDYVKSGISKNAKKTKWVRIALKDNTGSINIMIFNDKIDECKEINGGKLPEEDNILYVRGSYKGDAIFATTASVQDSQIYVKLSELKDKSLIKEESI